MLNYYHVLNTFFKWDQLDVSVRVVASVVVFDVKNSLQRTHHSHGRNKPLFNPLKRQQFSFFSYLITTDYFLHRYEKELYDFTEGNSKWFPCDHFGWYPICRIFKSALVHSCLSTVHMTIRIKRGFFLTCFHLPLGLVFCTEFFKSHLNRTRTTFIAGNIVSPKYFSGVIWRFTCLHSFVECSEISPPRWYLFHFYQVIVYFDNMVIDEFLIKAYYRWWTKVEGGWFSLRIITPFINRNLTQKFLNVPYCALSGGIDLLWSQRNQGNHASPLSYLTTLIIWNNRNNTCGCTVIN